MERARSAVAAIADLGGQPPGGPIISGWDAESAVLNDRKINGRNPGEADRLGS
jgi:hypothetical protein